MGHLGVGVRRVSGADVGIASGYAQNVLGEVVSAQIRLPLGNNMIRPEE